MRMGAFGLRRRAQPPCSAALQKEGTRSPHGWPSSSKPGGATPPGAPGSDRGGARACHSYPLHNARCRGHTLASHTLRPCLCFVVGAFNGRVKVAVGSAAEARHVRAVSCGRDIQMGQDLSLSTRLPASRPPARSPFGTSARATCRDARVAACRRSPLVAASPKASAPAVGAVRRRVRSMGGRCRPIDGRIPCIHLECPGTPLLGCGQARKCAQPSIGCHRSPEHARD